jgi:pimeloyl-ACP methyl ester carboxylesterase
MRYPIALALISATLATTAIPPAAIAAEGCGEAVMLTTRGGTTMRYSFAPATPAPGGPVTLVMLVGGGGYLDIDDGGCPRLLSRNVLVRMRTILNEAGVATALVDTPFDLRTDEEFGVYRIAADHAQDIGKVIEELRARTKGPVWIAGHSRGSISAANAAARLTGPAAPNGVTLLSAMYTGDAKARRAWAAHTVFFADLDAIKIPVLVIGHTADNCVRSPADQMKNVIAKTNGVRQQTVTVTGGPLAPGRSPSLAACEVREPHDFTEQEAEVAAGVARFMRGNNYWKRPAGTRTI